MLYALGTDLSCEFWQVRRSSDALPSRVSRASKPRILLGSGARECLGPADKRASIVKQWLGQEGEMKIAIPDAFFKIVIK